MGHTSRLMRIIGGARLRAAIPNPSGRERTIPLYIQPDTFCRALGRASDRGVMVLLVDRDGTVVWQSHGEVTPDKVQALAVAIADAERGQA